MNEAVDGCAVCGVRRSSSGAGMARLIIEGRSLRLCQEHAVAVAIAMPKTFEDMRALFARAITSPESDTGAEVAIERRARPDRRRADDRRMFPPRPEGRRLGYGRRSTDLMD